MYCENCRICKGSEMEDVITLGDQTITSRFPKHGDFSTPKIDVTLCLCKDCGLLQLRTTTESAELYEHEYGYQSGISNTMRKHLSEYKDEIVSKVELKENDIVLDIGSNDSTMLQNYKENVRRIGVDPTGRQFAEKYVENKIELLPTYFTHSNVVEKVGGIKCKIISSISMFYDLPDPVKFAQDIHELLDDNGIWTCEQSYLLSMLKTNSIDTICHEHLEYYSLHQIKEIADRSGFKIVDVKFNSCNGGSFRVYLCKENNDKIKVESRWIKEILEEEERCNLKEKETYKRFISNCEIETKKLKVFIETVNQNEKKAYIYGASTKGNCLLQYCEITDKDVKYAVERNHKKVGKMTSTGIEIISEETMRREPPDYLIVLPWHFKEEIIAREAEYLSKGGQFIFPFPKFEIVGDRPKMMITGCDGMLSRYIKKFNEEYNMYGVGHGDRSNEKNVTKSYFDINDTTKLESFIKIVKPDCIVHLASISSSKESYNPVEVIRTNGMSCVNICEIIYRNKLETKLFNAASSDMYKGHINRMVEEDDKDRYHLHPYSIAKTMSSSIVEYYREKYDLPFSNGIIFTSESQYKKPCFLLKKISDHIKNKVQEPLVLGKLDSMRNILHASDTAEAIKAIIQQKKGDTYLICNETEKTVNMETLVIRMYEKAGISLTKNGNEYIDQEGKVVLKIKEGKGVDDRKININGKCKKLKSLGWVPRVSIESILEEYLLER